ncbi:hypothetical protein BZA05DRAFT_404598 [Tricharina praecox]|uniref:uncharacterized protein n=1 Tax=Tricharina praecox TaxID=43433 RepID=UPI0022200A8D|nr:uncharacterized protein BZA05DRAFT_404598 [Tricharina praecox]KAI5848156.1 hypothetical protein BZA05DRAFT_404598 [Tricharina praecox]
MQATQARTQKLADNLRTIISRVSAVPTSRQVRLVAVSKLKPAAEVLALHTATGHRHMGENYVQELLDKAAQLPREIDWHFIGQLQTNKCRKLAEEIHNLWAVESVDTCKKADALEKGREALTAREPETSKLRVYVQVNTSGESSKSGCAPTDAAGIARHIRTACPHLTLQGLMTIGSIARSQRAFSEENEDFVLLAATARGVEEELGLKLPEEQLELSMGMSSDFEQAIAAGATSVRVGTAIFGERRPRQGAQAMMDVVTEQKA